MKEVRFFYTPDIAKSNELPADEAGHAIRVLRLQPGDEICLMDGAGVFYRAEITVADSKHCFFSILEKMPQERSWGAHLHLAMAPTKNMDRIEWFAEKATEIGFDELTFLNCSFSERKVVKDERIMKILISAAKQSHKAWVPRLNALTPFHSFLKKEFHGQKFIAHCYKDSDLFPDSTEGERPYLFDALEQCRDALVLIGPEGDFSVEEVRNAILAGFQPISLGKSRLRTETAALVAVHLMNIKNQI